MTAVGAGIRGPRSSYGYILSRSHHIEESRARVIPGRLCGRPRSTAHPSPAGSQPLNPRDTLGFGTALISVFPPPPIRLRLRPRPRLNSFAPLLYCRVPSHPTAHHKPIPHCLKTSSDRAKTSSERKQQAPVRGETCPRTESKNKLRPTASPAPMSHSSAGAERAA